MSDSIRAALERLVNAVDVYDATGMDVLDDAIAAARTALAEQQGETPTTDWKALCVELLAALENAIRVVYHEDGTRHISTADPVIAKADAALAQQQGEGPSDEELNTLWNCSGIADEHGSHTGNIFEFARAVLARWGHPPARLRNCPTHGQQPPEAWGCPECVRELRKELAAARLHQPTPPAEGEVGELVESLLANVSHMKKLNDEGFPVDDELPPLLRRAAKLLQQQEAEIQRQRKWRASLRRYLNEVEAERKRNRSIAAELEGHQ